MEPIISEANLPKAGHEKGKLMRSVWALLSLWMGISLSFASFAQEPAAAASAVPTGNQVCRTCHLAYEGHKEYVFHSDCQACHTLTDPNHILIGGHTVKFPDTEKCLACHKTNDHKRMNWAFSEHQKANVQCRDCHGVHSPKKPKQPILALWKMDQKSAVCMDCHQDIAARLGMPSHHPVKEGALSCMSCHEPHNGKQTTLLSKNEQCFKCHQAIRGPKVFEHAPVVEDCTICHNPHGTPNRRLLQISQPMQCLQCHSMALTNHPLTGGSKVSGVALRNCTSCHGAIHGSHIDPKLKH